MSLRPNEKKEVRRTGYKLAVDIDGRRRREEELVRIRKACREGNLLKRRRQEPLQEQHEELSLLLYSTVSDMCSDDRTRLVKATRQIRQLVSKGSCSPINEVVQAGVVPHLVGVMAQENFPQLQQDAAYALVNISSGTSENSKAVIDHGAVPVLIKLLSSSSDDVRELAVWALGNIAGDNSGCEIVLRDGALLPLLSQFNENAKPSMLRRATWTLSNFCRAISQPFEQLKPALPVLRRLLHWDDEEVMICACWALSYLAHGNQDKIQMVLEAGVCPRLIEILLLSSLKLVFPALRTIGHIVTGKISQTQAVIDAGLITPLANLLHKAEFEIKKEAAWAIANASYGGNHEQIKFVASQGCVGPLCEMLTCCDLIIVSICLEAIGDILKAGRAAKALGTSGGVNLYRKMVEDVGGRDKIESLENHNEIQISDQVVRILGMYWSDLDDELSGDNPMA